MGVLNLLILPITTSNTSMKKIVWLNKSNGQLCVTIPKNSGINDGDIVSIEKDKVKKIVYSFVTGDLFHYGHLQLLEKANKLGDFHICGVLTNEAIESYKSAPVAQLKDRVAIISALRCVDMVMTQDSKDATNNLKKIHERFSRAKIIIVHAKNWEEIPGSSYVEKIGGEVVKLPYYAKLSDENINRALKKVSK
jgi:cytidyltransferase-like protein